MATAPTASCSARWGSADVSSRTAPRWSIRPIRSIASCSTIGARGDAKRSPAWVALPAVWHAAVPHREGVRSVPSSWRPDGETARAARPPFHVHEGFSVYCTGRAHGDGRGGFGGRRPIPVPDDRRGPGSGGDRHGGRTAAAPDARGRRRPLLLLEMPAGLGRTYGGVD